MTDPGDVLAELAADPDRLDRVPDEDLPDVLAALEGLRARLWMRMSRPPEPTADDPPDTDDQMLDAEAVAAVLDVDVRYVYDHAEAWPFARRISPRKLRFSERGLYRWLNSRR